MIGYWGNLQFEVNSDWMQYPANIERTVSARYKTNYPANSTDLPVRQFLGPDVGVMTFDMYLDQRFNSNLRELLDKFTTWVNEGVAGELVIGTKVYGHNKWVCTKAVEKLREVIHGGVIVRAVVNVTLEEY